MKTSLSIWTAALVLSSISLLHGAPAVTNKPAVLYVVTGRDANSRIWERTVYRLDQSGKAVPKKTSYTELATGLHYQKNGQWVESKEQIDILPDGTAAATQGQHQAYFPSDVYQGEIVLVTPDGVQMHSRPMGLSYFDGQNSVLIAELKDSIGRVVGSNQVIYPDAFTDFKADLRYTYTKAGFEQDIVLREQPPVPEKYGLESSITRLQVLTEFYGTPEPSAVKGAANPQDGLQDTMLTFGKMRMVPGKAFAIDKSGQIPARSEGVSVSKSWQHLEGRTFLVEELPVPKIEAQLEQLPMPAIAGTTMSLVQSVLHKVSATRLLPATRLVLNNSNSVQLAKAGMHYDSGVVLDYTTVIANQTNYTFQGDMTYYVNGEYNLNGATTIEGGAVIKLGGSGQIDIDQNGTLIYKTAAYRPAVFTSINDNSVGEGISGSSGSPALGDVYCFLSINATNVTLHDLRFSYCWIGVMQNASPAMLDVWNSQFENVDIAVYGYSVGLHNVLIGRSVVYDAAVFVEGASFVAENVTADNGYAFIEPDYYGVTMALTNCLITGQPLIAPGFPQTPLTNSTVCIPSPTSPVYQVVGGGNYYLTNNSPYRDAGTTNINFVLLSALRQKTTYWPIIYSFPGVFFSTSLNLFPQATRDTDTPDLGYHYDPLDYVFGSVYVTNAIITLNPGTAIGVFQTNSYSYGLAIADNAQFLSKGSPTNLNRIVEYKTVQEQAAAGWLTASFASVAHFNGMNPTIQCRFTDWSVLAQDAPHIQVYGAINPINFQDCQFHGGQIFDYDPTVNFTNCLLERVYADLEPNGDYIPVIRNNLIYGGTFGFGPVQTNAIIKDNLFDRTTIPDWIGGFGLTYNGGYNAYVTNCDRLHPAYASDRILTSSPNYQSSFLGNYYLPTNSPIINGGSTTADQVGLYHYTTQTNQVKETSSTVDIGYHYVAVDANGNPIDTNGNGIPDYLEDATGSGQSLTINLIAPVNYASYAEPATIPVQASVMDWQSIVTNITFLRGSTQITGMTNTPYAYSWPIVAAGAYSLTAIARDLAGLAVTSAPINVTVTNLCGY